MKRLTDVSEMVNYINPKDLRHNVLSWTDQENARATKAVTGHSGLRVVGNYFHMDQDTKRPFEDCIVLKTRGRVHSRVHGISARNANVASA
jgi:hypothetical protein